jgi:hypothetical protein
MSRLSILLLLLFLAPISNAQLAGGTLAATCSVVVDNTRYVDGDCDGVIDSIPTGVAPIWSATPNCTGTAGTAGSCDISSFVGGTPTPTISKLSGTYPAWASLLNGILSWTTSAAEGVTSNIVYTATNTTGSSNSSSSLLTILAPYSGVGDYPVAWESQFNLPPQDVNGWSIFTPSSDSRLIYVSSTDGNDGTAQTYLPADAEIGADYQNPVGSILPYATISAAFAQARSGYPDYVIFKRGDTWTGGGMTALAGRGISERSVITSYGASTTRPLFKTGGNTCVGLTSALYSAVVGIHCYAHTRNPADPDFAGLTSSAGRGIEATSSTLTSTIVEGSRFDWYRENKISAYNVSEIVDIIVRRNIFTQTYNSASHSQGFYSNQTSMLMEENIFYHNGWVDVAGTGDGQATIFNHSMYIPHPRNSIFRKNISISPSSIHFKFTSHTSDGQDDVTSWNVLTDNNLLIDGEVGISLGGNTDNNNGFRWREMYVTNNVLMRGGESQQTGRDLGYGIGANDWESGLIQGNVVENTGSAAVNSVYAINLLGHTGSVDIVGNYLYDVAGDNYSKYLLQISGLQATVDINVDDNYFIQPRTGAGDNPRLVTDSSADSNVSFSGNTYYSEASQSVWFERLGVDNTPAQWAANTGETGASTTLPSFVDAGRGINDYLTSIGETATLAEYIYLLLQQTPENWDARFDAQAVNDYIRAGYAQ